MSIPPKEPEPFSMEASTRLLEAICVAMNQAFQPLINYVTSDEFNAALRGLNRALSKIKSDDES